MARSMTVTAPGASLSGWIRRAADSTTGMSSRKLISVDAGSADAPLLAVAATRHRAMSQEADGLGMADGAMWAPEPGGRESGAQNAESPYCRRIDDRRIAIHGLGDGACACVESAGEIGHNAGDVLHLGGALMSSPAAGRRAILLECMAQPPDGMRKALNARMEKSA